MIKNLIFLFGHECTRVYTECWNLIAWLIYDYYIAKNVWCKIQDLWINKLCFGIIKNLIGYSDRMSKAQLTQKLKSKLLQKCKEMENIQ